MPLSSEHKSSSEAVSKPKKIIKPNPKAKPGPVPEPIIPDEDDSGDGDTSGSERPSNDSDNGEQSSEDNDDSDSHSGEDDDVDQEGLERLVKALGEDGLDDFDRVQLQSLNGGDEQEQDGWESVEEEEGDSQSQSSLSENGGEAEDEESEEKNEGEENKDEAELGDDAILLEDAESIDEDVVPKQKVEIDNKAAMDRIRETIELHPSMPWTETLAISYPEKIDVDVDDDLNRELSFYKQALASTQTARELASKHSFPFTRPTDFFAEMVKSDAHMERIRQRLLDESVGIKKGEEKRREREGKKFGKKVQVEKLKEREKGKKDMEERLKGLKRKRKDVLDPTDPDSFDIQLENALDAPGASKRPKSALGGKPKLPRVARDQKFGFGGKGRRDKQNTRASTDDFGGKFGGGGGRGRGGMRGGRGGGGGGRGGGREGRGRGGMKSGPKRLGKSRRATERSKK